MSDAIGMTMDRKELAPHIRFERIVVEDVAASLAAGRFVGRDVDYAVITPPYSKDNNKHELPQYWQKLKQDVAGGRFKKEWLEYYLKAYESYKQGQELPLDGAPIKGWGVISPAQQETLIRMNILTVESLAAINDEGIKRIGMGALDLKTKAKAWLQQLSDKGPLTQEIAAVRKENDILRGTVESMNTKIEQLTAMVQAQQGNMQQPAADSGAGISASDLLDGIAEQPVVKRGPGRPKKETQAVL